MEINVNILNNNELCIEDNNDQRLNIYVNKIFVDKGYVELTCYYLADTIIITMYYIYDLDKHNQVHVHKTHDRMYIARIDTNIDLIPNEFSILLKQ